MLARANRVTHPRDIRMVMRRGRRVGTPSVVVHVLDRREASPSRFAFIVSKAVGSAVVRNRVRRRLRAVSHELLPTVAAGIDVVIRALPGSDKVDWGTLHSEIADGLQRGGAT